MRDRLKKSEFWSAMILLVLHVAVFPIVLSLLSQVKGYSLSAAQTNLLYYSVSLLLVALLLGRYLRRSFDRENAYRPFFSAGLRTLRWVCSRPTRSRH